MTKDELQDILDLHRKWLYGEEGGKRADLRHADLRHADLSGAYLRHADLRHADLSGAYLSGADLRHADLRRAYLDGADLSGAYLDGADLSGAYLGGADLSGAYLSGAYLGGAYLRHADLRRANLSGAYLSGADLRRAYLDGADLSGADLSGAYLSGAYLSGAYLSGAYLGGADLSGAKNATLAFARTCICPQEGSFVGWKKAYYRDEENYRNECIVKLEIPADAKRSSGAGRKCRASKAHVMGIETIDGKPLDGSIRVFSDYDRDFTYANGFLVEPTEPFCENRWEECASGIHFFITREEAVAY